MRDTSCSAGQPQGKATSLGRGLLLLTAVGFAAALGSFAYFQSEPAHLVKAPSPADAPAQVAASSIGSVVDALSVASVGEQVLRNVDLDQPMQKVASIIGSAPAQTRATAVIVGTGLVAMSPLGAGLMHPAVVYTATKVLIPDVVKFISL